MHCQNFLLSWVWRAAPTFIIGFDCSLLTNMGVCVEASLGKQQVFLSEKVVQRLMKQERLIVAKVKRRRYSSYLGEICPAPENVINRDFRAAVPNEKWLTDITEFQIPAGKVYLSPMIDCFDGMVISWSIGTSPDASLS